MEEGGGREEEGGGEKVKNNGIPSKSTKFSIKAGFIISNICAERFIVFYIACNFLFSYLFFVSNINY